MVVGSTSSVNWLHTIKHSQLYREYAENPRLQWLVLLVIAILAISVSKSVSDLVEEQKTELLQQLALAKRLEGVAKQEVDTSLSQNLQAQIDTLSSQMFKATSSSTAEAMAIANVESELSQYVSNLRLTLISSEVLVEKPIRLWSVRLEVTGTIANPDLPTLLSYLDNSKHFRKTKSIQHSSKRSGAINFVVDSLFSEITNE